MCLSPCRALGNVVNSIELERKGGGKGGGGGGKVARFVWMFSFMTR